LTRTSTRRDSGRLAILGVAGLCLAIAACERPVETVPDPFLPTSAHDAYGHALEQAELDTTALGTGWQAAARAALEQPVDVTLPFRESGWFDATHASAVGYRFAVDGGRRIVVDVEVQADADPRLFLDLYRLPQEPGTEPVHVATGPALDPRLEFEPLREARYVLRVQPELLRELRYTATIRAGPQLDFPVEGLDTGAIQSVFGAPRDAGRRRHHGVDIFAPRGTPVLAATDGIVRRVDVTDVGGNVVWLRDDERRYNLYYAHLERHVTTLRRGQHVERGQLLGYVGNSGNARTTPPHLHFGVYARGPVDPDPFLRRARREPEPVAADPSRLGMWARTLGGASTVRPSPSSRAEGLLELPPRAPLRVHGASARWLRVELPSGAGGYVATGSVEPATEPLRETRLASAATALHRPDPAALELHRMDAGTAVPVLGAWEGFLLVPTPRGRPGWLLADDDVVLSQ